MLVSIEKGRQNKMTELFPLKMYNLPCVDRKSMQGVCPFPSCVAYSLSILSVACTRESVITCDFLDTMSYDKRILSQN